jgi:hypothetical protein
LSALLRFTDSDFPFGILKLFLNALRFILVWFVLLRGYFEDGYNIGLYNN